MIPYQSLPTDVMTQGHFAFESGHHGDLWLDLDSLFTDAKRIKEWVTQLATEITLLPDVICGPLVGGAFVAQLLAIELSCEFAYAERWVENGNPKYRVPPSLRHHLQGKRVLVADDAINAGSALLGTLEDLTACGAELVGIASIIASGENALHIANRLHVSFYTLFSVSRSLWTPETCPLCHQGNPLSR